MHMLNFIHINSPKDINGATYTFARSGLEKSSFTLEEAQYLGAEWTFTLQDGAPIWDGQKTKSYSSNAVVA